VDGVGLDIEPDARIFLQITKGPRRLVPMLAPRLLDRARLGRRQAAYRALVEQIRADGWRVENYQFPLIADERQAGSTLLQRLALVDVATDREVWMLYSSFMRALGPGLIWVYGPEAPAIAVGTTGDGPDIPGSPQMPTLNWEDLAGICGWPALLRSDPDPQPGRVRLAGLPAPAAAGGHSGGPVHGGVDDARAGLEAARGGRRGQQPADLVRRDFTAPVLGVGAAEPAVAPATRSARV
jgi:hypothetical protein